MSPRDPNNLSTYIEFRTVLETKFVEVHEALQSRSDPYGSALDADLGGTIARNISVTTAVCPAVTSPSLSSQDKL